MDESKAKDLFKLLSAKTPFTAEEFEFILPHFELVTVDKKEKLFKQGEVAGYGYIINKGLMYLYKTLDSGDMQVVQFAKEGYWIGDFHGSITKSKALFTLETLEPCECWRLKEIDFEVLSEKSRTFETYFHKLVQLAYANTLVHLSDIYTEDAEAKYQRFCDRYPAFVQRVPQYLIASYLGILPSSLSRIRSKKQLS